MGPPRLVAEVPGEDLQAECRPLVIGSDSLQAAEDKGLPTTAAAPTAAAGGSSALSVRV